MIKTPRTKMRTEDAHTRHQNFLEVALGYSYDEAIAEAKRCIDCKTPKCVMHCPVNVNIPLFIQQLLEGALEQSFETIYKDNILPSICGRVCPQESQCEGACILGIKHQPVAIGALERFVGDYGREHGLVKPTPKPKTSFKAAIVGSGPAGLACAAALVTQGVDVTIYEALHKFGGVLQYGIPDFRLPKDIVESEVLALKAQGVKFVKNAVIGKSLTIDQLFEMGYQSIFIGSGAGLPTGMRIPGENLNGVYFANEFLTRVNLMRARAIPTSHTPVKLGPTVAVVGGGNVAMDAARTAKRLGAQRVLIIYRRDETSLPARLDEVHHAKDEGIEFHLLRNPVELIGENHEVKRVKVEIMTLGEPDDSGRRRPVGTKTYKTFDIDTLIMAIGQKPNPILKDNTAHLNTASWGGILTDERHQTSIPHVYAGGDVVSGAATVILAMGTGKEAARYMLEDMRQQSDTI